MPQPRPEYPRPQLVRPDWINLNGEWDLYIDDEGAADASTMVTDVPWNRRILVPFPIESSLSGIGDTGFHDRLWYRRKFFVPRAYAGKRILLHFGAVDYRAHVWLNGRLLGSHAGGYTPFSFDVTDALLPGENVLLVKVEDSASLSLPRGKQYWKEESEGIYYTRCTGIWQTVWLEAVPEVHVAELCIRTDAAAGRVDVGVELAGPAETGVLTAALLYDGAEIAAEKLDVLGPSMSLSLTVGEPRLWSPETPHLYDLHVSVSTPEGEDAVSSYVGIRTVEIDGYRMLLNGERFINRLALDQAYYPGGVYTAPSDEAIRADVELAVELGFNGVRRHQVVSDPRYLYWCDVLGLSVWGEMANAHEGTPEAVDALRREWREAVRRDRNHPCITVWVPYNESWGLPENAEESAAVLRDIVDFTRALDPTRPVIDNSGWQHVETDIADTHDYARSGEDLAEHLVRLDEMPRVINRKGRPLWADGATDGGQPIVVSEMGGIALAAFLPEVGAKHYGRAEADVDALLERLESVISVIVGNPYLSGFCYTQLYDVEQEVNGLATYDRRPKADPALIRAIIEMAAAPGEQ